MIPVHYFKLIFYINKYMEIHESIYMGCGQQLVCVGGGEGEFE